MKDEYELSPEEKREAKRQAKAAKVQEAEENAVVQGIMSTPGGRAWMRSKLEVCQIFHSTFTGEAVSGAFNEGRRTVGLMLLAELMRACPEQYIRMMGEQSARRDDEWNPDDERNWDGDQWIGAGPED